MLCPVHGPSRRGTTVSNSLTFEGSSMPQYRTTRLGKGRSDRESCTSTAERKPITVVAWASAIAHAFEASGGDSERLFAMAEVAYEAAADPEALLPTSDISRLFELAVSHLQDPDFGLKVAPYVNLTSFHALGYSLYSSRDLHDLCDRLIRFFQIHSDNVTHSLKESRSGFTLRIHEVNKGISTIAWDAWLASLVQFCRLVYKPNFNPRHVDIRHAIDARSVDVFKRFFRSSVRFDADRYGIEFAKSDFFQPLPAYRGNLARRNVDIVIQYLGRIHAGDLPARVEAVMVELLPTGHCSKQRVAEALGLSERTLQYRLESLGTSYSAVLDGLRNRLALNYLAGGSATPTEVSCLLGFSCGASFTRAFRRWTGVPPSRFVAENAGKH
jgi:AraC-like DNA-binding protein